MCRRRDESGRGERVSWRGMPVRIVTDDRAGGGQRLDDGEERDLELTTYAPVVQSMCAGVGSWRGSTDGTIEG